MQNIQESLTGLWPATGASSRGTARFAVSISASLTAGLTTSVDMDKTDFFKNHGFSARCPAFFFQKLNMSDNVAFYQGWPCLLRQKWSTEKETPFILEVIICVILIYTMDHPKFMNRTRRKNPLVYKGLNQAPR